MIIRWPTVYLAIGLFAIGFVLGVTAGSNAVRLAAEQAYIPSCSLTTAVDCEP